MSSWRHLAGRFAGSLWPGGPSAAAEAEVAALLSPGELALWRRMSGPDRRHAVGVMHRLERALGAEATPSARIAALLHDAGKVEAGLGTFQRVLATLAGRRRAERLPDRYRRYLEHDRIGAALLDAAGADPLVVTWARQHHLAPEQWTLPRPLAAALKAADGD